MDGRLGRAAQRRGGSLKRRDWILAAAIFTLNLALNLPMFQFGESPYRGSIEGGYISMSRFFAEHPNPWGWNPTQYCGLPTQFSYPPFLHYLDALFYRLVPGAPMENVYRLVTCTAACLAPVFVFVQVLAFVGKTRWAAAAALLHTLLSPLYGLYAVIDRDRGVLQVPWRLEVLLKYGEGPHSMALAVLPLALTAVWVAGKGKGFGRILLAAALLAVVALTNWIGALALAICCLCLLLAYTGCEGFRSRRVAAASALGYLLACFWLTPSYIWTTAYNWPADSFNYQLQRQQGYLLAGLVAGAVLIRAVFLRFPAQRYLCFLSLAAFVLGYLVTGFYVWHLDTIPESRRYALEFELMLILLLLEVFRLAITSKTSIVRQCAAAAAVALLLWEAPLGWRYMTGGWSRWKTIPKEATAEYKAAKWVEGRKPQGRVYVSGGMRFRLNEWTDLQQVGGVFDTALRNRVPQYFGYQIRAARADRPDEMPDDTLLQMRALGIEYVVVHGEGSEEYYKDYRAIERFPLIAREVHRDGADRIYQADGWALAHLVRPDELPAVRPLFGGHGRARRYVAAMSDPARPRLRIEWKRADAIEIEGRFPEGMLVAVGVNYDPGWQARQNGSPIAVKENTMGFISLETRPAEAGQIELRYQGRAEQRAAAGISSLAWLGSLGGLLYERRRRRLGACRS